jgi:hypothetical protein
MILAAIVAMTAFAVAPASAQATAAPGGSYLQSCQDISFKNGVLKAACNDGTSSGGDVLGFLPGGGKPFSTLTDADYSSLKTVNCDPAGDIFNHFGTLYCIAKKGAAAVHAIPAGSYLQSCNSMIVITQVLHATCDTGDNSTTQNHLTLAQCDLGKSIDNISGQLICSPATAQSTAAIKAATQPSPPPPSPVQAALKAAGCSWFLGRANQYLCTTPAAFSQCVGYVAKGQVMSCMAPNQIHTDCKRFLGRNHEYLCTSRVAFLQCQNYLSKGQLGVTKCIDGSPKKSAMLRQSTPGGELASVRSADFGRGNGDGARAIGVGTVISLMRAI